MRSREGIGGQNFEEERDVVSEFMKKKGIKSLEELHALYLEYLCVEMVPDELKKAIRSKLIKNGYMLDVKEDL